MHDALIRSTFADQSHVFDRQSYNLSILNSLRDVKAKLQGDRPDRPKRAREREREHKAKLQSDSGRERERARKRGRGEHREAERKITLRKVIRNRRLFN